MAVGLVWLVGFGSLALGWILDHASDKVGNGITPAARILYFLSFLIVTVGTAVALEVARHPASYNLVP